MIDLLRSASASPLAHIVPTDPGNVWIKDDLAAIDAPPDSDADPSPDAKWPANAERTGVSGVVGPRIITLPDGRYRLYYTQITPRAGFPSGANDYGNASSRILSAISSDGSTWTPEPGVRLTPQAGGAGDFRVVSSEVVPVADQSGIYGYAVPQLYVELAQGDWRIKAGKFYTMTGYEVVQATGNFFYSHAYTMYNSEPFTHSGFVATYSVSDDLDVYAGWVAGWDTGLTQFNNGSQFLGGFAYDVSCDTTFTYIVNAGSFGQRQEGYMHSMVLDHKISDCLNYVIQSDLLDTNGGDDHSFGVNQYLIYTVSDCLSYGGRAEWYKFNGSSQYATTFGVNYKAHANLTLRPEIRHDWNPSGNRFNGDGKDNFTTVAMDAILTF
ncbi:MAG: porin [Planctomycetes bacterium]|nr:porin [Planctomycetota bacterium]